MSDTHPISEHSRPITRSQSKKKKHVVLKASPATDVQTETKKKKTKRTVIKETKEDREWMKNYKKEGRKAEELADKCRRMRRKLHLLYYKKGIRKAADLPPKLRIKMEKLTKQFDDEKMLYHMVWMHERADIHRFCSTTVDTDEIVEAILEILKYARNDVICDYRLWDCWDDSDTEDMVGEVVSNHFPVELIQYNSRGEVVEVDVDTKEEREEANNQAYHLIREFLECYDPYFSRSYENPKDGHQQDDWRCVLHNLHEFHEQDDGTSDEEDEDILSDGDYYPSF